VTLPVAAAMEYTIEIGLPGGFSETQAIVVNTSFVP
jgi:hypothetical protein